MAKTDKVVNNLNYKAKGPWIIKALA